MLRYGRNLRILAMGYAMLAGAVDAIGSLRSGGLFVSFMSGNSTRLSIGVTQSLTIAVAAATLVALFVAGVIFNVLIGESAPAHHRKFAATLTVTLLLVVAAAIDSAGRHRVAVGFLCVAMGSANAIFRRDGEVGIGVTYMTGTLVKLGHRLADLLRGTGDREWLSYFLLWLSLVLGGIAGASAFIWSPNAALWCAAATAAILSALTFWLMGDESRAAR